MATTTSSQQTKVSTSNPFDVGLGLEGSHVLVTGGAGMIGRRVVQAFLSAGSKVSVIDVMELERAGTVLDLEGDRERLFYTKKDISSEDQVEEGFRLAEEKFGTVEVCGALASLDLSVLKQSEGGCCDVDVNEWKRVMDVNVTGTFLTCRRWLRGIRAAVQNGTAQQKHLKNPALVIIGSESGRFGVPSMPAYAAGKSAVQLGLMLSFASDAPKIHPRARVNAVAPGAVATELWYVEKERYGREWEYREAEATVPLGRAVPPQDVARTVLFCASERYSGSVHGQLIPVDGGKSGVVVWGVGEVESRGLRR
jgi:NAD(P)-dependent dehydrogenase (short-subunit alcohol dehydrogenase family)